MSRPLNSRIPLEYSMPSGSSIRRVAKAALRKCHLMRPFRFYFPPEIWIMILEWVLEPTVAPYKYCTSENFSHYQAEQFFFADSEKYSSYRTKCFSWNNEAWLRVSLVCHAWADLVGPPPCLDTTRGKYQLHYNVRNMKCSYTMARFDNPLEKLTHAPPTSNHLTTLEIIQEGNVDVDRFVGVDVLLDNYMNFPMLRSLRIEFKGKCRVPEFWSRLEKGFPDLIALALTSCPCSLGTIRFEKIKIFMYQSYLDTQNAPMPNLQLPRLKHCTIDQGYMNSRQFILDHGHQLESLCFLTVNLPLLPADLWALFPNLSTLEVGGYLSEPRGGLNGNLPPLPSHHPLHRLVIHLPSSYVDAVSVDEILRKVPTIGHLSITQSYFHVGELSKSRRIVTRRGVKFDVHAVVNMLSLCRRLMECHPWGRIVGLGTYLLITCIQGLLFCLCYAGNGVINCFDLVTRGFMELCRKLTGESAIAN